MKTKIEKELKALTRLQDRLHKLADGASNPPLTTAYFGLRGPIEMLKQAAANCEQQDEKD